MAATHDNTLRYSVPTHTANLATDTTLGTATRLDFTTTTLYIPETTDRDFVSVVARMSFRDAFTAANAITGVRMGVKLGSASTTDTDRSFTQANTGDHLFDEWTLDVTSYFDTNFGSGGSQTCVMALAVSTTSAADIGGGITCELEITYAYDATTGSTRAKTIPIVIGSHSGSLTTSQQEVGVDGTGAPSANQIPILTGGSGLIKEASPTIRQAYIVVEGCENQASTVDSNPEMEIDSTGASTRGVIEGALQTVMPFRDIFLYDTATHSTTSAHAFKMRDTTTTARFPNVGGILWVTYEYDKSSTTRMLNVAIVPLVLPSGEATHIQNGGISNNVEADAFTYEAQFDIQEPGTVTLERAGIQYHAHNQQSGSGYWWKAVSQTARTYTPQTTTSEAVSFHRTDFGSGWTVARGFNRLPVKWWTGAGVGRQGPSGMIAYIVYSSDVPAQGVESGNRSLSFFGHAYGTAPSGANDIAASGGGQQNVAFTSASWRLSAYFIEGRHRVSVPNPPQVMLEVLTGELGNGIGWLASAAARTQLGELASVWYHGSFMHAMMKSHLDPSGRLNPETARRYVTSSPSSVVAHLSAGIWRTQIHNITHTVAGTITVDGADAPDGGTVLVYDEDGLITSSTLAAGDGTFSIDVTDDTTDHYVVYQDGTDSGASLAGTPGTSTFDVTVGGGSGGYGSRAMVVNR